MSNEQFLEELEAILRDKLPPEELENVMAYHREYFAEAGENAAAELDPPEIIAQRVMDEYLGQMVPVKKKTPAWLVALVAVLTAVVVIVVAGCVVAVYTVHSGARFLRGVVDGGVATVVQESIAQGTGTVSEPVITQVGDCQVVDWALDTIDSIVIEGVSDDVVILQGSEDCTLHAQYDTREVLDYSVDDGILHLTGRVTGAVSLGYEKGEITVTLPADQGGLSLVQVGTDMGDVILEGVSADEAELETGMGNISVSGGRFTRLDCDSDMGDVSVTGVEADALNCYCDAGSVEAMEFSALEATLEADLGNVTALVDGSLQDYALELEVDLGQAQVAGKKVPGSYATAAGGQGRSLSAKADVGNVTVDFTH